MDVNNKQNSGNEINNDRNLKSQNTKKYTKVKKLDLIIFCVLSLVIILFPISLLTAQYSSSQDTISTNVLFILKLMGAILTLYAIVFTLSKNTTLEIKSSVLLVLNRKKSLIIFFVLLLLYNLIYLQYSYKLLEIPLLYKYQDIILWITEFSIIFSMLYITTIFFIDQYKYDKNNTINIFKENIQISSFIEIIKAIQYKNNFDEKYVYIYDNVSFWNVERKIELINEYANYNCDNPILNQLTLDLYLDLCHQTTETQDVTNIIRLLYDNEKYDILCSKIIEKIENAEYIDLSSDVYIIENKIFTDMVKFNSNGIDISNFEKQFKFCTFRNKYILEKISDKRKYYEYLFNFIMSYLEDFSDNIYLDTALSLIRSAENSVENKEVVTIWLYRLADVMKYQINEFDDIYSNDNTIENIILSIPKIDTQLDIRIDVKWKEINNLINEFYKELQKCNDYSEYENLNDESKQIVDTYVTVSRNNFFKDNGQNNILGVKVINNEYNEFVKEIENQITEFINFLKSDTDVLLQLKNDKNLMYYEKYGIEKIIGPNLNKRQYFSILFDIKVLSLDENEEMHNHILTKQKQSLCKIEKKRKLYINSIKNLIESETDMNEVKSACIEFQKEVLASTTKARRLLNILVKFIIQPNELRDKFDVFCEIENEKDPLVKAVNAISTRVSEKNLYSVIHLNYQVLNILQYKTRFIIYNKEIGSELYNAHKIIYYIGSFDALPKMISKEIPNNSHIVDELNEIKNNPNIFLEIIEKSNKGLLDEKYLKYEYDFYQKKAKFTGMKESYFFSSINVITLNGMKNDYMKLLKFIQDKRVNE